LYLYKKEMYDSFRFKFDGIEDIEQNYSQCMQDMFVLSALNGKRNGKFLEIGAFMAKFISNTYLLERNFDWNGISIDIERSSAQSFVGDGRTAKFILSDALVLDYEKILSENFENKRVDYLQIDIEPNINTLSCLKLIPLDKYRFSVITYEHDHYDPQTSTEINDMVRDESRRILKENGYVLVAGNLSNIDQNEMEDWFLDGQYFSEEVINKFKRKEDTTLPSHLYMLGV